MHFRPYREVWVIQKFDQERFRQWVIQKYTQELIHKDQLHYAQGQAQN